MPRLRSVALLALCPLLGACEPAALALLGGGVSTVLRYNLDGIAARTFTAPAGMVKSASLAAAERMGLSIEATATIETGEVIRARAPHRAIEIGVARQQLLEALHMALLVGRHLGGEGAHRVIVGMLGDIDVEVLRAPLGGERQHDRVARGLRQAHPVGIGTEVVPGVLPRRDRRQLALRGAEGERLVLLLLLAADALEFLGDDVEPGVAHGALELDEALERLALDGERVCIQFDQGLRQESLAHGSRGCRHCLRYPPEVTPPYEAMRPVMAHRECRRAC